MAHLEQYFPDDKATTDFLDVINDTEHEVLKDKLAKDENDDTADTPCELF